MPISLSQIDKWIILIQNDELEECLKVICALNDKEFKSSQTLAFSLSARLADLNKTIREGTISKDKQDLEKNKIRMALLEMLLEQKNKALENKHVARTITLADNEAHFQEMLQAKLPRNRYTQLECVSHGDYCLVYKAIEDEGTDYEQTVAIKVFKNISLIDQENLQELKEKFSKSKRYSMKDGIITILEDDLQNLPQYYIMPYINGMTLADYLKYEWPMSVREIKDLLVRTAQALFRGHRDNLLHLNLRPSNIMIDKEGDWEPQIFPFQVVRFNISHRSIHRIKQIVSYWSPEQINGTDLTHRADQFSLALVAFELFKLKPFFRGENVLETLKKRIQFKENPELLKEELQTTACPPKMIEVIAKMLQERPEDRFRDMRQVLNKIESIPFAYEEREDDFQLLVESFNRCRKSKSFYRDFYQSFFKKRAQAEAIFKKRFEEKTAAKPANAKKDYWKFQHHMLDLAINRLLVFYTNPNMVTPRISKLTADHKKYGAMVEDFPVFLDCLRDTLALQDPGTWGHQPEVLARIWKDFTKNISG